MRWWRRWDADEGRRRGRVVRAPTSPEPLVPRFPDTSTSHVIS
nr:MAG TPA: hypothetical protein [Caudoviricetes sp.]